MSNDPHHHCEHTITALQSAAQRAIERLRRHQFSADPVEVRHCIEMAVGILEQG